MTLLVHAHIGGASQWFTMRRTADTLSSTQAFLLLSEASDGWRALWPPRPLRRVFCEVRTRQLLSPGNVLPACLSCAPRHREMNRIFVLMCSAAARAQWLSLSHPGTAWLPDQLHKMSGVYCSVPPAFATLHVAHFTIFTSLSSPSLPHDNSRWETPHPTPPQPQLVFHPVFCQAVEK